MRILIVEDGRQRGALAAMRSLGRAGHEVGVAASVDALSGWSRWCERTHRVPRLSDSTAVKALEQVIRDNNYDVVFGVGDSECLMLASARDQLKAVIGVVEHDALVRALDKTELGVVGDQLGIRTPSVLDRIPDTLPSAGLIIKEKIHGQETAEGRAGHSAPSIAHTVGEAQAAVAAVESAGGTPLLQEALQGELIAYCVVRSRDGRTVGDLQQRALKTFPPGAGVSVRAETTPVDEQLREQCLRLLDTLGIWGVAEIQFIAPPGEPPALIDVNPRFYGSMALAIKAGIDLPVLATAVALEQNLPSFRTARTGVRYQWLEGDIRRARIERKDGFARDLVSSIGFAPGAAHSILALRDPKPPVRFLSELLKRGIKKGVRRS